MTIITHLKITFIITFLSGLIYWNLLTFSCGCEDISSFEVVPEYFLLSLSNIQLLGKHLPRDDKLTLNQNPSRLSIGIEMLTQRYKMLRCLNNVLSISAKNVFNFFIGIFFFFFFFMFYVPKSYVLRFNRISSIKTKARLHHECSEKCNVFSP